jgi:hypothetical protein
VGAHQTFGKNMKRVVASLVAGAPVILWACMTLWNVSRGTLNTGLHMLPINAVGELIQISHGMIGRFPGWWASALFGCMGAVIGLAWIFFAGWSVKASSPAGALVTTIIFSLVTAGWSLFIIIPRLVVPTG